MLKRLTITNLAIIENIDVTFRDGFTVLTGGTGAGKSLVIDSLSLLLGARAASELIRSGEEKAVICGLFELKNSRISAILNELDIPFLNDELTIERTISRTRNVIKVNGVPVSLLDLNRIAKYLADIHSQFDFSKILNPENYLEIIDGFSFELTSGYKKDYAAFLADYQARKRAYEELTEKKRRLDENRDFLEYQYNELKASHLKEGEEEEITSEIALLKNYDKIFSMTEEADEIIHGDMLEKFYELNKILSRLSEIQPQYGDTSKALESSYYDVEDRLSDLSKKFKSLDFDPNRLDELQTRESDLAELKRKYRKTISELIAYRDELSTMIGKDSTLDKDIEEAEQNMLFSRKQAYDKALELSEVRKSIAKSIEKEVESNLSDLLLKAKFRVSFSTVPSAENALFAENGLDAVDFLIETNIGEGLKSLSRIVSGGEASRIMLAFKSVFIRANRIATVIFDEIDTGISGEAAEAVARKIHEISLSSQVIAITHMPQIASLSDHHILISKEVKSGRTYTRIKELNLEEKIAEVAHLISGSKVTEKQLDYAREMVLSKR